MHETKHGGHRFLRRILFGFLGLTVALLLAILFGALVPLHPEHPGDNASRPHHIRILASAIHTNIALPVDPALAERFAFLRGAGLPIERADWLIVGRGGRSFYVETPTWSDLKPGPLARALTLDSAVMHVGLSGPFEADGTTREFRLSDAAYEALLAAIERSFASRVSIEGAGYGPYDRFFEATGSFNALVGCNVWTSAMLRQSGIVTGLWTPLPQTLRWSLDLHGPLMNAEEIR